jgi:orotate phosphoribosyltransferase
MNYKEQIAINLLEKEAVKISMDPLFSWTSGIQSPVYCDNRKMISFVEARDLVVQAFIELIKEKGLEFDVIGGTATAAIPWAAFVAQEMKMPMIYIRPAKKAHGGGKQIEGHLSPNQKVLIIEDLISTGGSSVKAAQAVREEGLCQVTDILAIVTYGFQKSIDAFQEADLTSHTLTNFDTIVENAAKLGKISPEQIEEVLKFAKDPEKWRSN